MHARSTTRRLRRFPALFLAAGLLAGLAACEDEATAPIDSLIEGEATIDASSPVDFTYFSLTTGETVDVADPLASTDWDVAFRRFNAKLNGGVAGGGNVEGYNLANNANATAQEVVAFTPADGEAAFAAVTEADIAGATFREDGLIQDPGGSWFRFSPQANALVANPGAAWKVRAAGDGHALFRVVELVFDANVPQSATVEFRYQADGSNLGSADSVTVDYTQGPGSVDFSTGTVVAPDGCNWDVVLTPQLSIDFNSACDAGSFPLDPSLDFTAVTTADDAPAYAEFLSAISGAIPNAVDGPEGVFWYDIEGNRRLWPTYNVFLVRKGTAVFKVQVTDYYSDTGASGFPTIRYEQIQ